MDERNKEKGRKEEKRGRKEGRKRKGRKETAWFVLQFLLVNVFCLVQSFSYVLYFSGKVEYRFMIGRDIVIFFLYPLDVRRTQLNLEHANNTFYWHIPLPRKYLNPFVHFFLLESLEKEIC